ncbi:MAG: ElyC/SanA/YdcF family protein, partial [Candidatus Promineifilaceae bacterium]
MIRRFRFFFVLLLVGGLLFVLWSAVSIYVYSRRDEAQEADAAIVLGAAVFGTRPSPVLRERINHAVSLYEAGYVDKIIFTGGLG